MPIFDNFVLIKLFLNTRSFHNGKYYKEEMNPIQKENYIP